jgi:ubiquinone/menaquinone biosynthesis C-methylase UbiE
METVVGERTNKLLDYWEQHWQEHAEQLVGASEDTFRLTSALELLPGKAESALDVGGGDGAFAVLVGRWLGCTNLMVVDSSTTAVSLCQERGIEAMTLDVESHPLPFEDGAFEVVTCLNLLEDVLHPWALLEELIRISHRWVIISCSNLASWRDRWEIICGGVPKEWGRTAHLRLISFREVVARLHGMNVRVTDFRTKMRLPLLTRLGPYCYTG